MIYSTKADAARPWVPRYDTFIAAFGVYFILTHSLSTSWQMLDDVILLPFAVFPFLSID